MLADSHCHLENNNELPELIKRAKEVGVGYILDAGSNIDNINAHIDICERYEGVYTAAGAHPHEAKKFVDLKVSDIVKIADNSSSFKLNLSIKSNPLTSSSLLGT